MPDHPSTTRAALSWRDGLVRRDRREIATETAVALSYDGTTHAVMMATPQDLAEFAIGFSLTEGLIAHPAEIRSLDICPVEHGIDVQMWLVEERAGRLAARRRATVGPAGCGLCGVESLAAAIRELPQVVSGARFAAADLLAAMRALPAQQALNTATRAVHAAAFWQPEHALTLLREDVGRHNALDKLAGALAMRGQDRIFGAVLLTSRVSVEMVQKAAVMGAPLIAAVSAPTSLAIDTADRAGITLVAVARDDGFEVFTHEHRLAF